MRGVVGLVCTLMLCVLPLAAQSLGIAGIVRDPQQAVVVGAQVILKPPAAATRVTTVTDGPGRYGFAALDAGRYVVEVRARGFQVASEEITLGAGEGGTRDFVLALARKAES